MLIPQVAVARPMLPVRRAAGDPADLDPLGADALIARVPALNASGAVGPLGSILEAITPSREWVGAMAPNERLAAMRDLGLLLGSLRRHGVDPLPMSPHLEAVLLDLGARTGMIPRDTVHHYTDWNPAGARERLYLGDAQERELVDAVRQTSPHLGLASRLLVSLRDADPADPSFAPVLSNAADETHALVRAIKRVMEEVSPVYFVRKLRPYFDPITVGGTSYYGPAAAHLPVWLLDLALWASDDQSDDHAAFIAESSVHTRPEWQCFAGQLAAEPSLVTRIGAALELAGPHATPALLRSGAALRDMLRTLVSFRGKHLTLARRAYRVEITDYRVGSGGGSLALLNDILQLTRASRAALDTRGSASRPVAECPAAGAGRSVAERPLGTPLGRAGCPGLVARPETEASVA